MNKEDNIRIGHMLQYAKEAVKLSSGKTREDIEKDRLLNLALVRLIGIIGEAAYNVSSEGQMKYPLIPWPQIIGMRHRLVHGYDFVDFDILYETLSQDLPPLITELEKIVTSGDKS
jgi:uncharacterized protein with HEPN domain